MTSEEAERHIMKQAGLAAAYAGDGALTSAARLLETLTVDIRAAASAKARAMETLFGESKTK